MKIPQAPNRIVQAFAKRRAEGQKTLIVYLMAGDPNLAFSAQITPLLHQEGADIVELGHPFSDPIADGPVIQQAAMRAMKGGLQSLSSYLGLVEQIRQISQVPLALMTYYNPIFCYGEVRFLKAAQRASLDGVIVPDMPAGEAVTWRELANQHALAPIPLEAPNTDADQAQKIVQRANGFIYLVSLKGVTGAHVLGKHHLEKRVRRLRALTSLPLAAGFGIATPQQAKTMANFCDGVVVGSALIRHIHDAKTPRQAKTAALQFVSSLRNALSK